MKWHFSFHNWVFPLPVWSLSPTAIHFYICWTFKWIRFESFLFICLYPRSKGQNPGFLLRTSIAQNLVYFSLIYLALGWLHKLWLPYDANLILVLQYILIWTVWFSKHTMQKFFHCLGINCKMFWHHTYVYVGFYLGAYCVSCK